MGIFGILRSFREICWELISRVLSNKASNFPMRKVPGGIL